MVSRRSPAATAAGITTACESVKLVKVDAVTLATTGNVAGGSRMKVGAPHHIAPPSVVMNVSRSTPSGANIGPPARRTARGHFVPDGHVRSEEGRVGKGG